MGIVKAEITLKNTFDQMKADEGSIPEKEIRTITLTALVDTGASTLVINEEVCRELGLAVKGTREVSLADNKKIQVKIVDPVEIHWKNRSMMCQPMVASDSGKILLGAIPLEAMDLIVDPLHQELIGAHGDNEVLWML